MREIFFKHEGLAFHRPEAGDKPKAQTRARKAREKCPVCKGAKKLTGKIDGKDGSIPCPFCRRNKGRVRRYGTRAKVAVMQAKHK